MPLEWRLRRTFGAVCGQRSIMPAQKPHFPNGRYIEFPLALIKFRLCKSCSLQTLSFFYPSESGPCFAMTPGPKENFSSNRNLFNIHMDTYNLSESWGLTSPCDRNCVTHRKWCEPTKIRIAILSALFSGVLFPYLINIFSLIWQLEKQPVTVSSISAIPRSPYGANLSWYGASRSSYGANCICWCHCGWICT